MSRLRGPCTALWMEMSILLGTPPGEFFQTGTHWFQEQEVPPPPPPQVQQVCWSHVSCFLRSWPPLLSFWCPNEIPLGAATYTTVNETITATKHLNHYDFVISLFQHIKCVLIDVFFSVFQSLVVHGSITILIQTLPFLNFYCFPLIPPPPTPFLNLPFLGGLSFFFRSFCRILFSHVIVHNHAMQIHPIRNLVTHTKAIQWCRVKLLIYRGQNFTPRIAE